MQIDFHYYATYCAAFLAGFSHEESLKIGYASQFTDCCSRTLIKKINGPDSAVTTQLQSELAEARTDKVGLQDITRIWASFHFLPGNLQATFPGKRPKKYMDKYRMICLPNGELVAETVNQVRGQGLAAIGMAMHVLADTWAHRYFAGTPSYVINDADYFEEMTGDADDIQWKKIHFIHNPVSLDDPEKGVYSNSIRREDEHSIMNLGHGRAGHLPDYSFIRYRFLPAWGEYEAIVKDNPSDYYTAFCQMLYALKVLRTDGERFLPNRYDEKAAEPYRARIESILKKRQILASEDWCSLGEDLSKQKIPPFDINLYQAEYVSAEEEKKDDTFLGQYFLAALKQKSMVTGRVYRSGNLLCGYSVDYEKNGFRGIRDFIKLTHKEGKGGE